MTKEALKLALEALELHGQQYPHMVKGYCLDAITSLRKAIEQAKEQDEPVAWMYQHPNNQLKTCYQSALLYTTPPQRKPLTDEQIADIVIEMNGNEPTALFWRDLAKAIEAAHGIKENT